MKIAVLSDIHSNVFALQAVLENAKSCGVEKLVNLGDIFYGPIAPRETFKLLKKHNFITISGNQDRQIIEASDEEIKNNPTLKFILEDLKDEPIAWIKSLPFDLQLNDDTYLCHGSPKSDMEYLLEDIKSGAPVLKCEKQILKSLNGQKSNLIICGHSHIPRSIKISTGQFIVNPGSVGMPAYTDDEPVLHSMENYSPHACYSIIEKQQNDWVIYNIKVPYDYQKAAKMAYKNRRYDWEHYIKTGRKLS